MEVNVFFRMDKFFVTVLMIFVFCGSCKNPTASSTDDGTNSPVSPVSQSSNADLSSLTIDNGELKPAFDANTTTYTVSVFNNVSSVTVNGTKADKNASISSSVTLNNLSVNVPQSAIITVTAQSGLKKEYSIEVTRSANYSSSHLGVLKFVPAGSFQRDSTASNISSVSDFRMSEKEITRAQFESIMLTDPSHPTYSSGKTDPVQMINWYHAITFCNKLSLAENLTPVYSITVSGNLINWSTITYADIPTTDNAEWNKVVSTWENNGYRLPTEMEWMWAAMGANESSAGDINLTGYKKAFAGSTGKNKMINYVWYDKNSSNKSHPVGSVLPNELGIYDLSGNVYEMCWDEYGAIPAGKLTDYHGSSGNYRVTRGGSWYYSSSQCSVNFRSYYSPEYSGPDVGFRVVRF